MQVVVLMSTYNGTRFVAEQVASILAQLPADGLLMVRDDGSTDDTVDQIEAFKDSRLCIVRGQNLGFAHSFLTLLAQAPSEAQMLMFSDQDDVWLPGKIDRAWSHLLPLGTEPALYCSAQTLVDETLAPLEVTPPWPRGPSFASALAENIVTGCTAALNRSAAAIIRRAGVPVGVRFHDWWLYLIMSAFGTVVVDDQPTILYRQHRGNAIGRGAGWWGRHIQIAQYLCKNDWVGILLGQVLAIQEHYWVQLAEPHRELLGRYFLTRNGSAKARWRLIFSFRRWRQSGAQELVFRGLLVLHRLRMWPPLAHRL